MSAEWASLTRRMHGACVHQEAYADIWWTTTDTVPGAHAIARWIGSQKILSSLKRIRRITHNEVGGIVESGSGGERADEIAFSLHNARTAAGARGSRRFFARFFSPREDLSYAVSETIASAGFPVQQAHTLVIPLSEGEDAVQSRFDRSVRKNLRKAVRQGISIHAAHSDRHFDDYYSIMAESRKALGLSMFPRRFWDLHRRYLAVDDRVTFYVAYLEERPLACLGAGWGRIWVTELLSGTSQASRGGSHFVGEALKWRVMKDAIQRRVPFYDLAGVRVSNATSKEEAIFRYKRKFGGHLTTIPIVDMEFRRDQSPTTAGGGV